MRWTRLTVLGVYRGERRAYRLLVRTPESKRPLGRPRFRCKDNIKTDLGKYLLEGSVLDVCVSGWGEEAGYCEKDNEIQFCIKCQKYFH